MANEEQLSILKQGVEVWNRWREENPDVHCDLSEGYFREAYLKAANLSGVNLWRADLCLADLEEADLRKALINDGADLSGACLRGAHLDRAELIRANLSRTDLRQANLNGTKLMSTNLCGANLLGTSFEDVWVGGTNFGSSDLSQTIALEKMRHYGPSIISTDTFALSKGNIPEAFLRGCGLSDWEIEMVKLYNPDLSNDERNKILYKVYDLQAKQAIQVSPLFISYSHGDKSFVDQLENQLNAKGIRFWRDIYDMKAGRIETQIDRAISQNRTVLLVLSEHSAKSDWVEHEVRTARGLEKDMGRDVLCPVALDDSWKSSPWPKRVMEQIMEYNILDFSAWKDDVKFEGMFRKLIDGLELFYK